MVRISLKEQYDNKDVIQQIYSLKDRQEELENSTSDSIQKAEDAISQVEILTPIVESMDDKVTQAQTDATSGIAQARTAQATANGCIKDASIVTTSAEGTLNMVQADGTSKVSNVPLANESQTGLMNAQTYQSVQDLNRRVSALEASQSIAYVVLPSTTPTQAQISEAFESVVGRAPLAGDIVRDIAKSLTYEYDGSTWIQTASVASTWSNTVAGIVKGTPSTGASGTLFAEEDGTGSVNGWDELNTNMTNGFIKAYTAMDSGEVESEAGATSIKLHSIDDLTTLKLDIPGATQSASGVMSASDKVKVDNAQSKISVIQITLPVSGWDSSTKSQAVVCPGMTADATVWVSPAPDSFITYGTAQTRATVQGIDTLTFACENIPTTDLTVNVGVA